MKIRRVTLDNIRSHKHSVIDFKGGFNCIVGGVGGGKSSVVIAIHFGLFGERLGRGYDYMLREGEQRGYVEIEFEHKGTSYRVVRALKRDGQRISQDLSKLALYEDDRLIASGKSTAINEQICAVLGIDEDMFRSIVWIPQEKLKELLNLESSKRQEAMDGLFGISDFSEAWQRLRSYEGKYEGESSTYQRDADIANVEKLRTEYNESYDAFVSAQLGIEGLKSDLGRAKEDYERADEEFRKLDRLRSEMDKLERERSNLEGKIEGLEREKAKAESEAKRRNEAMESLKAAIPSFEAKSKDVFRRLEEAQVGSYALVEELLEEKRRLESLESSLSISCGKLEMDLRRLGKEEVSAKGDLAKLEKDQEAARKEQICPLCRRPILETALRDRLLAQIDHEVNLRRETLAKIGQEVEQKKRDFSILLQDLDGAKKKRSVLEYALEELEGIFLKRDEAERRINQETMSLREVLSRLEETSELIAKLNEGLSSLYEKKTGFDIIKLQEATRVRDDLYRRFVTL